MRNSRSTEVIALLTAAAAAVTIFLSSCELPPRIDHKLHAAIGKSLAKEALGLLGRGGKITLIARDTEAFPQPATDALLASFRREVRRAGAAIAAIQLVQTDPLRPVDVPPGDFFELLRRSRSEHVIVSLLGPPLLTEEQRQKLGRIQPKVVAFCSGNLVETVDLRQLFNAGLLHAAVISRSASSFAAETVSKTSQEFDQLYKIVEAADLSKFPSPSRSTL